MGMLLIGDVPPLGVFGRGETAERRVRSVGVVLDAPGVGEDLGSRRPELLAGRLELRAGLISGAIPRVRAVLAVPPAVPSGAVLVRKQASLPLPIGPDHH